MKELKFGYQLDEGLVVIMALQGGHSAYAQLDQLLAELEIKVGPLARKHILCEGEDGFWDLILPTTKGELTETKIYPLNSLTLAQAKVKLAQLVASGQHLRIIA